MMLKDLIDTEVNIEIKGISYNSRNTKEGDVFVAIKGFATDGHNYAKNAVKNGAVCVISEHELKDLGVPYIIVEDTRKALATMSHKFYGEPTKKLKLIGITGTNGKTTSTYIVKSILEQAGKKVGLIGTNQILIGDEIIESKHTTPESLELAELLAKMVDIGCEYAVMEVSSHSLELSRVYGCNFEACGFTNLTQDHLDFHINMENYYKAKEKLFSMCKYGIFNIDDASGARMAKEAPCHVTTYGIDNGDISATNVVCTPLGVGFDCLGEQMYIAIPGMFSVYNTLVSIGICHKLGISLSIIKDGIKKVGSVKGRVEIVPTNRDFTIIIDYAHTPDGLKNVLQSMKEFATGRLVVLFGCGGDRDKSKRPKMGKVAGELADLCIITSDNPRSEEPAAIIRDILSGMNDAVADYIVLEQRRDAIEYAIKYAKPKDVIVLAGKGHETYQVLKDKTIHFDEREIIAEILKVI